MTWTKAAHKTFPKRITFHFACLCVFEDPDTHVSPLLSSVFCPHFFITVLSSCISNSFLKSFIMRLWSIWSWVYVNELNSPNLQSCNLVGGKLANEQTASVHCYVVKCKRLAQLHGECTAAWKYEEGSSACFIVHICTWNSWRFRVQAFHSLNYTM